MTTPTNYIEGGVMNMPEKALQGTIGNEATSGGIKRPVDEEMPEVDANGQVTPLAKQKRKKQKKVSGPRMPKGPVMQLNELKPDVTFVLCEQSGPVHAPMFIMEVDVNGQKFKGTGTSKKIAKGRAAEIALKSFIQFPNASDAFGAMTKQFQRQDFTEDIPGQQLSFSPFVRAANLQNSQDSPSQPEADQKNPLMILNQLRPGLQYTFVSEEGEHPNKEFFMSVTVDNQVYQGQGRSKQLAKGKAAQVALTEVYNMPPIL